MKHWILIVIACLLLSGCASVKYNTETKELEYTRIGNQRITDLEIVLSDGSGISIGKQESETSLILKMFGYGVELGKSMK